MKDNNWIPNMIKIAAVCTAAPRWVGALLAAEGFIIPVGWLAWWVPVSAILSAAMAIVEGMAFAYVFEEWRNQSDSDDLFWFALVSALTFVGVLAPYIAASVKHVALSEVLANGWALGAWSVAVGLSTIAIVASTGYAQKRSRARTPRRAENLETHTNADSAQPALSVTHVCGYCGANSGADGRPFKNQQSVAAHLKYCDAFTKERSNGAVH